MSFIVNFLICSLALYCCVVAYQANKTRFNGLLLRFARSIDKLVIKLQDSRIQKFQQSKLITPRPPAPKPQGGLKGINVSSSETIQNNSIINEIYSLILKIKAQNQEPSCIRMGVMQFAKLQRSNYFQTQVPFYNRDHIPMVFGLLVILQQTQDYLKVEVRNEK